VGALWGRCGWESAARGRIIGSCRENTTSAKEEEEVKVIYQTNPTEMFRERQLLLLSEAENRHLTRQLRKAHSEGHPRSEERRMAGIRRAIALWGRTSIPFFGS
jgi:hypothetical protein